MFAVKKISFADKALMAHAFAIRQEVFVQEQGVDAALEYDHEEESHHYLVFLEEKPVATARWRETEKGIKLERFAVRAPFRSQGAGARLLREILLDVSARGKPVYLHSQIKAVVFYERNGFVKAGDAFTEAGIVHFKMQLAETGGTRKAAR
jgi:predicted GNAT family N-acyltransferase